MLAEIRTSFNSHFDSKLVEELLAAYQETKINYYRGGLRLGAVEGGRFCEAAFRMLEEATTKNFTPLGQQLNTEKLITLLAQIPRGSISDSIRLHIPRALRVVYDIRNNRDAAHLADGIDPNVQDATLVVANVDWVLSEFVRLYHQCSPDEAHNIIDELVVRKAPAVQDFTGFLKVLKTNLKVSDFILLLLYERGNTGASFSEVETWIKPSMRKNLSRTLHRLVNDSAYLHFDGKKYIITASGRIEVERKKLHE